MYTVGLDAISIVTEKWDARPEHILVGLEFSLLGPPLSVSPPLPLEVDSITPSLEVGSLIQLYWKVL